MTRREDTSSRTVEDAAWWAEQLGRAEYIDDRPTKAELDAEERDAR